jgi:hypothetical protein
MGLFGIRTAVVGVVLFREGNAFALRLEARDAVGESGRRVEPFFLPWIFRCGGRFALGIAFVTRHSCEISKNE